MFSSDSLYTAEQTVESVPRRNININSYSTNQSMQNLKALRNGSNGQQPRAQTALGIRQILMKNKQPGNRRSQPKSGSHQHYESQQVIGNKKNNAQGSYGLARSASRSNKQSTTVENSQYANTQFYIQHGSQLLNKSLKGQIQVQSSSLSRKNLMQLQESRKFAK